ncbi:MAG: DUF5110 domain-containing protein [Bacteroidales bacterium]|nr:DUF5110 domain-containing protein [Bacteroidales bacterium]
MKHILKYTSLFCAGIFAMTSCSKNYEKTNSGIVVKKDSVQIRLQVVSSDIIRVTKTVDKDFSTKESLIVLPQETFTDWNVSENGDDIVVTTPTVKATVTKDGNVLFTDVDGAVLLQEKEQSFAYVDSFPWLEHADQNVHDHCVAKDCKDSYYRIMQRFESPEDEAFYGLGGHQHGMMNYKGKDVELAQHNMIPCIPFLYSNKNYGILWDNYSITRFGDTREYQQITNLKLYDKNGNEGGLSATYSIKGTVVKEQIESKIDYAFLSSDGANRANVTDSVIIDVLKDHDGVITWEGQIASDEAGLHKFLLYGSSYFKLWIDGQLIMDKWRQNWNPWSNPFTIQMNADEKHDIKIEWNTNWGYLGLTHLSPNPYQDMLTLSSEAGDEIDYYFVRGNNADEVVSGYRKLTGKATIVPKWAMGFWQSRQRYQTADEILSTVKTFRERHIPLDNIVLDWHYWPTDGWGTQTFDSVRFADPKGMVDSLHNAYNTRIMISVWPKFYAHTDNYKKMNEKGYIMTHNVDMKRKDWVAEGFLNGWYDVYNPGARDMFWETITSIYDKGFDAWWLDATEPDMHSNISVSDRKVDMTPNVRGNGERMFNAYATLQAKGVYENQRKADNDTRVFILTRSAFAGLQHYGAANWSGDIVARWSDLKDQVAHGTNFSIAGVPFWTMDIGGFAVEDRYNCEKMTAENEQEWKELETRWYQFGAFCPLYRSHGEYPYREVFNVAKEDELTYKSILYYTNLRYALMPYIYSLAGMTYHKDYTIMRPLVMDFTTDTKALNINDQYMFGPSLLVCPISEYKARSRKVYLPQSAGWYALNTGEFYTGGQEISADAPYEAIPVFVKAGSIIPTGKPMEYTNQYPDDELTVYVYAGANGEFTLYSDESTNYNYEKGAFAMVTMKYNDADKTLIIGDRQGSYKGMVEKQKINVVYQTKEIASNLSFDSNHIAKTVEYTGKQVVISLQ